MPKIFITFPPHFKYSNLPPVKGILTTTITLILAILIIGFTFGTVVPPGHIGIRQITMGPGQGYRKSPMNPGYQWSIPFYSRVHVFPSTLQLINLHRDEDRDDANVKGGLQITTADGAYVEIDVSVLTRFTSLDNSGSATILISRLGVAPEQWRKHIATVSADNLNRSLSALKTSEFYDPVKRGGALKVAEQNIKEALNQYGIEVIAVLLRRYTYLDQKIDQAIFDKNIQSQEEKLNEQQGRLSEVRAKLEQVSAELDAKIKTLNQEGKGKVQVLRSEADLYQKEKKAEGDLFYAKAEAEVQKLKATVLEGSAGADIYVAKELAPIVATLKGGIVTNIDPYNINEWLNKLGVGAPTK